jgi:hypothetical protein
MPRLKQRKVLNLPKSNLQITRGLKSRDKTIAATGSWIGGGSEEDCLKRVRTLLEDALEPAKHEMADHAAVKPRLLPGWSAMVLLL